ncbi:MAG: CPBP family glutamic-type intramembrane protease [Candidatus Eremiobacteraeota bacterium]|nr:CPBP family glutamic-type intramembrane protease [Candidatus Eremiobacteraeota bacterium]
MKWSPSDKTYWLLVIILALSGAASVFFMPLHLMPGAELPAPKPVLALANGLALLVIYGGLGFLGLRLSGKLGFRKIWDPEVSQRERFVIPLMTGAALGIFFILTDRVLCRFHTLGGLPHPPFPASILASVTAGIGEEIIFRLFFISLWVYLISRLLRDRGKNQVFWTVSVFSALAFAAGHLPAIFMLYGIKSMQELPWALLAELLLLNGVLSLFAADYLRKWGFLAAAGVHFWTDIVWHVIWGGLA